VKAVFALLRADWQLDELPTADGAHLRRYPRATDRAHLLSLVRDGRDPVATRWLRGTVLATAGGGALGALTMGVLVQGFGMLGGLLDLGVPLGFGIGAFLGAFTAAMTGTQVARDEVRRLAADVVDGDVLLQWTGAPAALATLAERCRAAGLPTAVVG
jgi:hypothetical protein